MYWVYAILIHLAFVVLLPVLVLHPKLRGGFMFRLGCLPAKWPNVNGRPVLWFHGASAGDLLSLEPIVAECKRLLPESAVVLTTITSSGMALARRGIPGVDAVGFLPFDLPWVVGRVLRAVAPDVLILEYAEVWPALIRACHRRGVRTVITNGRFDQRALGRYRFLYGLIGNPLQRIDCLCMRETTEREHALAIGAPEDRVRVTGNTKFDRCGPEQSPEPTEELIAALGYEPDQLLLVAGSTHEGEEGGLLDGFIRLRRRFPGLRMVIAPRYPERVDRVLALVAGRHLRAGLRSRHPVAGQVPEVIVLDTVGELPNVYRLADLVVIGGSFVTRGGQNILEPAACGKPVLFGPHMENFHDSVQILVGRGGIQVPDMIRLENTLAGLLADAEERKRLGALALQAVSAVRGASRANAEVIAALALARMGKDAGQA